MDCSKIASMPEKLTPAHGLRLHAAIARSYRPLMWVDARDWRTCLIVRPSDVLCKRHDSCFLAKSRFLLAELISSTIEPFQEHMP